MNYDDLKLPVHYLEKGVQKLLKYGMDVFELYADDVNMSFCDRNRVIAKCRVAYGRQDLKEMPCPDELKAARWECYTKQMRYSPDKARELLRKIDESYKNQFLPTMPKGIKIGSKSQYHGAEEDIPF